MFKSKLFSMLGVTVALGTAAAFATCPPEDCQSTQKNGTVALGALGPPTDGAQAAAPKAKIGEQAPNFALKNLDGKEVSLKDNAGKIVVLEWVNPGCPVCKACHEDGRIPKMIEALEKEGVVFLAINTTHNTTVEQNQEALKRYGIEYPVLLDNDGTVGHLYGAKTTPHVYVIDTKGVLRYQGGLDDDKSGSKTKAGEAVTNYALNAVKQIKAGETVTPDSAATYGCSVKYAKSGKPTS